MIIIRKKAITPGQRFYLQNRADVTAAKPISAMTFAFHRARGRNCYGRITSRRRGGGHKKLFRQIDFRRNKFEVPGKVEAIEYDPNRSALLARILYADGERRYILAPEGVNIGSPILSSNQKQDDFSTGLALPLSLIPTSMPIHCVELCPGRGAQMVRSAGTSAQILALEKGKATLKLASGEIRYVDARCRATIGALGNGAHEQRSLGKAGRNRWLGRRPRVRGVAMNPIDHPMGGGEGRTSGGGNPMSPWGQLAKGARTRKRSARTSSMILVRRDGRKMRKV